MRGRSSQQGFTLIELLIAVLIIGILAAIALPAFNKQRARAHDSRATQQLEVGLRAAKAVYADGESFPAAGLETLLGRADRSLGTVVAGTGFTQGQVQVERRSASRIILRGQSRSGTQFLIDSDESASTVGRIGGDDAAAGSLAPVTGIISHPSLEAGDATAWSWYSISGASTQTTFAAQTGWAAHGRYSLRVNGTNNNSFSSATAGALTAGGAYYMPVSAGQSYTAQARTRMLDPGENHHIRIYWYSPGPPITNSVVQSTHTSPPVNPAAGEESLLSVTGIAPSDATLARVYVYSSTTVASDTMDFYMDAAQMYQSSVLLPYCDGSTPGGTWTGSALVSTSTCPPGSERLYGTGR